jgi:hypothetical protein
LRKWAVLAGLLLLLATSWAGCQQNAVTVPVRSLERSGKAAFFCIQNPSRTPPGLEMRACAPVTTTLDGLDYSVPHTIGLVTQQARGEVAVVDLTAGGVIDVDPTLPGENFLPVGGQPTDIVATPGSTAAFVAIGDPVRPGIFALSSSNIYLPGQHPSTPPALAGFPACSLPSVPTQVLLVADRTGLADGGTPRSNCPGVAASSSAPNGAGYDLSGEAVVFGTQKILALMPELGEVAVIDAQALLWRGFGTFDGCPIERMISLGADTAGASVSAVDAGADALGVGAADAGADALGVGAADAGADAAGGDAAGGVCTAPPSVVVPPPPLPPHPVAMAYADDGKLYISDDRASVIHVVDLTDVCAPTEQPPLLPTATLEPTRAVTTTGIAVTPLLTDDTRFVYAVDVKNNGSVMVFDVSPGATQRTPILRPDVQFNQQEPPDRIAFSSPVVSLTFARHELVPTTVTGSGQSIVPRGALCDPTNLTDPYRPPTSNFISPPGAGPHTLRGVYGFLALSDGRLAVIDVDDFDAPCRRPDQTDDVILGCTGTKPPPAPNPPGYLSASQEVSCKVVERHRPRSNQYFTNVVAAGQHAPAMQGLPLLHDKDGTALSIDPARIEARQRPEMLSPRLEFGPASWPLVLGVTGLLPAPPDATWWTPTTAEQNSVAFDLREPRAHVTQLWTMRYEGAFANGSAGRLQCVDETKTPISCEPDSRFEMFDSSLGFCSSGVQDASLAATVGVPQGDVVEITSDFPDPSDPYWTTVSGVCSRQTCEQRLGTIDNLLGGYDTDTGEAIGRDFIVDRAYQDHLVFSPSTVRGVPIACCFPYPVSYSIRGGKQWIVTGTANGFAHRVVPDPSLADPSTGACVLSCDPNLVLRNGRTLGIDRPADLTDKNAIPSFDDPRVFRNSEMRFVIWNPQESDCRPVAAGDAGRTGPAQPCLRRDMFFSFQEVGGFDPLLINLSATALILPESISFVPGLEQLAIPDPVSQGLMMFDLNALRVIQTIF